MLKKKRKLQGRVEGTMYCYERPKEGRVRLEEEYWQWIEGGQEGTSSQPAANQLSDLVSSN